LTDTVFVSYSRSDAQMATLVVQLLRARDDVFYDVDSIPAGERWLDGLLRAIDNASHFYLLWCRHSAGSKEVKREWQRAVSGDKRLVPVLLDSTPLIQPLTEYQWVDFRGVVQGHEAARWASPFRVMLASAALVILIVTALLVVSDESDPSVLPAEGPVLWLALSVVAVLTLVALIARRLQGKRPPPRASELLAEAIAQDLATHGSGS
jgi:hypothetical protein